MKLTYISHTLLIFLAICWITAPWANAVSKPASAPSPATPAAPVRQQTWTVTVGDGGPDCFPRPVILVNDTFMPTLEVTEGDLLELTLINNMPEDFPMTPNGLTIHWHGFTMLNNSWYDGTSYVNICPVQPGKSFTYRFIVNEIPGSYIWHGHNGVSHVDGFQGPLIVRPRAGSKPPVDQPPYDDERTVFISDWWHQLGGLMAAGLNRPFVPVPNPDAGNFTWVGNPQAILINGKGAAQDCTPPAATAPTGTLATCNVTAVTYPANATASPPTPACSHAEILVEPGKTYLLRLISAVHLIYTTVCFEGHNLTIIAEDDIPVDPVTMPCVDIFSGQRFDVLLTANQTPSAYWMTAYSQYRAGAPNGYAILRYNGTGDGLPATATPQPGAVAPWTSANATQITMNSQLLASNVTQQAGSPWNHTYLQVPDATARLMLNLSQPVLNDTAQIRWAWDNVVMLENPPCENVQQILYRNPGWVQANAVSPTVYNSPQGAKSYGLGEQLGGSSPVNVFVANLTNPATLPVDPQAGAHIIPTQMGDVVEIVIQNNNASSFNGDIGGGGVRTTQETHPLHLHGHRYWLLAEGTGTYPGPEAVVLNTKNPVLVDSVVLYQNSYMVLRYVANNPGTWIFHCHIPFHQIMGQSVVFSEQNSAVSKPPTDLPACPNVCEYTAAPWNISYTDELFGKWIPPNPPPAAVAPAAVAPAASKGLAAMPTLGLLVFLLTAFAC